MTRTGDIVRTSGGEQIVVDIVEDDGERWAILRDPDDLSGVYLDAVDADTLTVIGHADSISGWAEGADGEWRRG